MARSGRKTIIIDVDYEIDLTEVIKFADHKANSMGIRVGIDYTHDQGLKLSVSGPKDKINLYEHQIREFIIS